MPNEFFYLNCLDWSISNIRVSAASDLSLHCLLVSLLWDARHKRVKEESSYQPCMQFATKYPCCTLCKATFVAWPEFAWLEFEPLQKNIEKTVVKRRI